MMKSVKLLHLEGWNQQSNNIAYRPKLYEHMSTQVFKIIRFTHKNVEYEAILKPLKISIKDEVKWKTLYRKSFNFSQSFFVIEHPKIMVDKFFEGFCR